MISYDEWYETAKPYLIHHCHHHLDSLQFLDLWPSWAPGTACVYVQTNMHQLYYKLTMALVLFPFKLIHSPNNYYELLSCFPSFYDSRYSAKGTCLHHSFVSLRTAQPSKTHRLFLAWVTSLSQHPTLYVRLCFLTQNMAIFDQLVWGSFHSFTCLLHLIFTCATQYLDFGFLGSKIRFLQVHFKYNWQGYKV